MSEPQSFDWGPSTRMGASGVSVGFLYHEDYINGISVHI